MERFEVVTRVPVWQQAAASEKEVISIRIREIAAMLWRRITFEMVTILQFVDLAHLVRQMSNASGGDLIMHEFRWQALGTVAISCMMLAGCGGGAVASAGSTPPPAPPAGANANLLGPLKSETFANYAAQASLSLVNSTVTGSAGNATASFVYDATNQSYTVTAGGASQTFAPAAISATQSNSAETLYESTNGSSTTSLTLTKPGTSGRFTYEYVGGAFWETVNQSSSTSANGTLYAIAYGEPTPAGAVPQTGMASFTIDLVGAQGNGSSSGPVGITGAGGLTVDFATGNLALGGTLDSNGLGFSGNAKIASGGSFTGQFGFAGQVQTGQMTGSFYGPASQEVGAAFSYTDAANSSFDATGVLLGRQATATGGDLPQMSTALRLRQSGTTTNFGTAEVASVPGEGTVAFMPDYTAQGGGASNIASALANANGTVGLTYLSSLGGGAAAAISYEGTGSTPVYDLLLINPTTPAQSLPATGYAEYDVNLDAIEQKSGTSASEVTGSGVVDARFSTGQITTSGTLNIAPSVSWSGTATLSSSTGQFSGTIGATGTVSYNGTWQGAFYGTGASGVGALLTLTGSDGSNIAGVIAGPLGGPVTDPSNTLQNLTSATNLASYESVYQRIPGVSPDPTASTDGVGNVTIAPKVSFDPTSNTYTITGGTNAAQLPSINAVLNPANSDQANTDATFTAYSGPNLTAKVFNPGIGNPALQLTYTSFAQVIETTSAQNSSAATQAYHYFVFGLPTNATAMPTTGTASYSGVVYGNGGTVTSNGSPGVDFSVSGTGVLNANFASGSINTSLNLTRNASGTTAATSLGGYSFSAQLNGVSFSGYSAGNSINGSFFGPNANEVGAAWSTIDGIAGAFVGKKS